MCAFLLLRGYSRSKMRLLKWSGLCFTCLTLSNSLIYFDVIIFPDIEILPLRNLLTFLGLSVLIGGMIKETV